MNAIQALKEHLPSLTKRLGAAGATVFHSKYIKLLFFLTATLISFTAEEVTGAVGFVVLICLALLTSEDITATTLPFLLLATFLTRCYDSYATFIDYAWLAIPALLCLVLHFVLYPRPIMLGRTFYPMLGVALALLLGGIGCLGVKEYFAPSSLYYTVFLGIGMAVAYLLLKPRLSTSEARAHLLSALYLTGLFAAAMIFIYAYENREAWMQSGYLPSLQASNNLSTLLLFALPTPFYYARKQPAHLLCACIMLFAILLSGSRGGLLFGVLLFLLCIAVTAIWDKKRRAFYVCAGSLFLAACGSFGARWVEMSLGVGLEDFIGENEVRLKLLERAKALFLRYPLFGHGLGYTGNADLYDPRVGAMHWYHMLLPQIFAGLGLCGLLSYGTQFAFRIYAGILALRQEKAEEIPAICTVLLSYSGVLMMSLVNPGLFCPIPYALLAVMLMASIDGRWTRPKRKASAKEAEKEAVKEAVKTDRQAQAAPPPRRHAIRRPRIGGTDEENSNRKTGVA